METSVHVPDVVQLDNLGPREDKDLDHLRLHSARLGARVPDSFGCPLATKESWNLASLPLLLTSTFIDLVGVVIFKKSNKRREVSAHLPSQLFLSGFSSLWNAPLVSCFLTPAI